MRVSKSLDKLLILASRTKPNSSNADSLVPPLILVKVAGARLKKVCTPSGDWNPVVSLAGISETPLNI
jgi:hypothetical protein